MAVTESDVRHVASLARLAVDPTRLPVLVNELNGILGHMEVLERVETRSDAGDARPEIATTPMRDDASGFPVPLARPREEFAPQTRDGFFLVPRLATHEDQGE